VEPQYPEIALRARIEGSVVLNAIIGTDGSVEQLDLVSGHPFLVDAAMEAVKLWQYQPYTVDGKPVSVKTVINVNFAWDGRNTGTDASADSQASSEILYLSAVTSCRDHGNAACLDNLEKFTASNPSHPNAWNELGFVDFNLGKYDQAERAFRKQIEVNPATKLAYNNLGRVFLIRKMYDEALTFFNKQLEINPDDRYAHGNIGVVYEAKGDFAKAATELEAGIAVNQKYAVLRVALANAYAHLGEMDKSKATLEAAVSMALTPANRNTIAYEMSLRSLFLDLAQKYAESAIGESEANLRTTSLERVTKEVFTQESSLASYWDTLGWVHFQKNEMDDAERYVRAAWYLRQHGVMADHLGQIYEKLGRNSEALSLYAEALISPRPPLDTQARWSALAGARGDLEKAKLQAKPELAKLTSVSLRYSPRKDVQATFDLAFGPGPTLEGVRHVGYGEDMKNVQSELSSAKWPMLFPDSNPTTIIRRIAVRCSESSEGCIAEILPLSEAVTTTDDPARPDGQTKK